MMRMIGLALLVGSLLLLGVMLVRFGTSSIARARDTESGRVAAEPQAVLDLSERIALTVKYVVAPAALLLLGGALIRSGRRDDRDHELRVELDQK